MRKALSTLCDATVIENAATAPGVRGKTLSVDDFVRLTDAIARA